MIRALTQELYSNRNFRFWFYQIVGWVGYSIGTFLTITLVDGNVSWPHVGHIVMSAVLGLFTSWPLRYLYGRTFEMSLTIRLLVSAIAVVVLSGLWTYSRILFYAWFVDAPPIWSEVNYWYFGSLFVFLSWTVLYYGIKYYDLLTMEHQKLLEKTAEKRAEQVRRFKAEAAAHEAQIRMLHYQLAPHFLFNTLNGINALVRLREVDRAQEMIQLLSKFLRHALQQDSVESVSLAQEIESLMFYLNIEKARFEDRLKIEFDIDPASQSARVPALLLQPIIENAMKYAIADSEEGGLLSIRSRVKDEELHIEVADSGPGMVAEVLAKGPGEGRGIGLNNVRERLQALYDHRHTFTLSENLPTGLKVSISIPLQIQPAAGLDKRRKERAIAQA